MSPRPLSIPPWVPAAVAVAFVVWAVSIWWMVATLPASAGSAEVDEELATITAATDALAGQLETLTAEVETLRDERASLLARVDELEAARDAFEATATGDGTEPEATRPTEPAASPFFTDGQDRYNCKDFASLAEAQEAFEVNRPGDPNRIDTNGNGLACEDFKYRAASATP